MLVTFSCDAHENIMMFGHVAIHLLKLMGHSGTVPSAILAEDVPQALEKLQTAINREKQKTTNSYQPPFSEEKDQDNVSLVHRALPLIELLQAASKHQCDVVWK